MADRIETFLTEAVADYRAGEVESAKTKVQKAYSEVFENLEGPIRINVSAKASFALEAEFGDIRKLIIDGVPVGEVEARYEVAVFPTTFILDRDRIVRKKILGALSMAGIGRALSSSPE